MKKSEGPVLVPVTEVIVEVDTVSQWEEHPTITETSGCRWPVSPDGVSPMRFCDRPLVDNARHKYCATHQRRTFRSGTQLNMSEIKRYSR